MITTARTTVAAWLIWLFLLGVVTAVMHGVRGEIEQAHVALIYLLVVLGGSVSGGRALGLTLACAGFLLIDYYFQPPFDTLAVGKSLDWLVLLAFLAVAGAATQLLTRAQAQADAARRRADEVQWLADLGSETLSAGRADAALGAIAGTIEATLDVEECQVLLPGEAPPAPALSLVDRARHAGRPVGEAPGGAIADLEEGPDGSLSPLRTPLTRLAVPLRSHGKQVGVLLLTGRDGFTLDTAQRRFLQALGHYAALGAERVRLVAEAERAEALREADRLKDLLLASVSHDLRTPLTTIKALAQQSRRGGDPNAAAIEEQADRLNRLVGDLLDLSRIKSGTLPLHPELNTVDDLIGTVLRQIAPELSGRAVRVALDLDAPALVGRFDLVQSARVLANVVENALKFSAVEQPVDIAARHAGRALEIAVADHGVGIAPAEAERIFDAFYRPRRAAPDVGGAGLGLAIARQLAEAQGGSVGYAPRPGGGSVFTIRLPAAEDYAIEPSTAL